MLWSPLPQFLPALNVCFLCSIFYAQLNEGHSHQPQTQGCCRSHILCMSVGHIPHGYPRPCLAAPASPAICPGHCHRSPLILELLAALLLPILPLPSLFFSCLVTHMHKKNEISTFLTESTLPLILVKVSFSTTMKYFYKAKKDSNAWYYYNTVLIVLHVSLKTK